MKFSTAGIPDPIVQMWSRADELWEEKIDDDGFESYASADYHEVFHSLKSLRDSAENFLEFGSGLGVVTLMASWLGFESYGIEARETLVDYSREFASDFSLPATFATGSFIPNQFQLDPSKGDESVRTFVDEESAYPELDMELEDFDLIYAYPWPTEHSLYQNVIRQFARSGAIYLYYDAREGTHWNRV